MNFFLYVYLIYKDIKCIRVCIHENNLEFWFKDYHHFFNFNSLEQSYKVSTILNLHISLLCIFLSKPNISRPKKDNPHYIQDRKKPHNMLTNFQKKFQFILFNQRKYIIYRSLIQLLQMPSNSRSQINHEFLELIDNLAIIIQHQMIVEFRLKVFFVQANQVNSSRMVLARLLNIFYLNHLYLILQISY